MTIPMWCLLVGMILPYVWAGASLPFRIRQFGDVDIAHPREQGEKLTGPGDGVWGAQMNAWEALAVFAGANLIAVMAGLEADGNWSLAAMIWVAARISHGIFYIAEVPVLRVLSFTVGAGMSLWIVVMAAGV